MAQSYVLAGVTAGMHVRVASPEEYAPAASVVADADRIAAEHRRLGDTLYTDAAEAAAGADVIVTDTWVSMGKEDEKAHRVATFGAYKVDRELMALAKPDAVFMHCLPADRGYEVTADVIDGPQSIIWDEAENRLHAQKALLVWLLEQEGRVMARHGDDGQGASTAPTRARSGARASPAGRRPSSQRLSKSTHFDWQLAPYDLAGSRAHARALAAAGYLERRRARRMLAGLDALEARVRRASSSPPTADEDVHGALEAALIGKVGPELGGKLRAGRSRNDQIATLVRLYLKDHAATIGRQLVHLIDALAAQADAHRTAIMPGARTCSTRSRCSSRTTCSRTAGRCPATSSGSSTGRSARMSRPTAGERSPGRRSASTRHPSPATSGSPRPAENSIDGTASRDVVAEFAFVAAMIGIDLSRIAEEVILWNTREFGFVTLDDGYSTGSSIMPQKKNPDIAELARGKSGRLIGNLTGLLATLKALPLAYNRDLQEDKEPVFDSVETLEVLLPAFTGMIATLTFHTERMAELRPRASRWPRMSRSGSSSATCRSATPTRSRAPWCATPRSTRSGSTRSTTPRSPRSRRTSRPTCARCSRSRARSRAATASAAPRPCASTSSSRRSPTACGTWSRRPGRPTRA